MQCPTKMIHIIRQGEDLESIARNHMTTVEEILQANPQVNPYDLYVGDVLTICMKNNFFVSESVYTRLIRSMENGEPTQSIDNEATNELKDIMKKAWLQKGFWTHILLVSVIEQLKDENEVTKRIMENPLDLESIYSRYYDSTVDVRISELFKQHLDIVKKYIESLVYKNEEEANRLSQQLYSNADDVAYFISAINPYIDQKKLKNMLYEHIDLIKKQIAARIDGDYTSEIAIYDLGEQQAVELANELSNAIIQQFPDKFV